jgi:hypothetical protein
MQGGAPAPGIPRPMDVPTPFGPTGGMPGASGRPPADPFAAPQARGPASVPPGAVRASAPPYAAQSADPFAASSAPIAHQEVRLVIDDKTVVADSEVGRGGFFKVLLASVALFAVGGLVGWMVAGTRLTNQLFDAVAADAKEVYGAVNTAAPTVEKAKQLIDQAVKSAAPGPGKSVEIDFKALEELRKLEKPFPGDVFSRKKYGAFGAGTVDALFVYYNDTNLLWAKLTAIFNKSLTPTAREALIKSSKAADDLAKSDFGCVPVKDGDTYSCILVSLQKGDDGKLKAVSRAGSANKEQYSGQDLSAKASDYVIVIDKGKSNEVLGGATSQFQSFARDLMEAKQLADQTLEMQGRLTKQLGDTTAALN